MKYRYLIVGEEGDLSGTNNLALAQRANKSDGAAYDLVDGLSFHSGVCIPEASEDDWPEEDEEEEEEEE